MLGILEFAPIEERVPEQLPRVCEKLVTLLGELRALPRTPDGSGMIDADFNDGNFTVDDATGDLTVFDFDDCYYGWFAYELASAWESGVGWAATVEGELSIQALSALIYGTHDPGDFAFRGWATLPESSVTALDRMFPPLLAA